MLDPVTPPPVAVEAETDGGVDAVRPIAADTRDAIASPWEGSTPLLWITAIAPHKPVTAGRVRDARAPVSPPPTLRPSPNLCPTVKTPARPLSPSSTTFFS